MPRNIVMLPPPPLPASYFYNVRGTIMDSRPNTHHQFLMKNKFTPSEMIENQRNDKIFSTNFEWIGSSSSVRPEPTLINFMEPSRWNNNEQFCLNSNELNTKDNSPKPQLEPQEVTIFNGTQKSFKPFIFHFCLLVSTL